MAATTATTEYGQRIHPICATFPNPTDAEFEELISSIKANGQIFPILRWQGQVVDGRSRLRACERLGLNPSFEDYPDDADFKTVASIVVAANLARRHLTTRQRAEIAARLTSSGWTQAAAAKALNVSDRTVRRVAATEKPPAAPAVTPTPAPPPEQQQRSAKNQLVRTIVTPVITDETMDRVAVVDQLGRPVPPDYATQWMEADADFVRADTVIGNLIQQIKTMLENPMCAKITESTVRGLMDARLAIKMARPYAISAGIPSALRYGKKWLSRLEWDQVPRAEKQDLLSQEARTTRRAMAEAQRGDPDEGRWPEF